MIQSMTTKKKALSKLPEYGLSSDIEEVMQFIDFDITLLQKNGRLFAILKGVLKEDGETVEVMLPLHSSVERIVRSFDPNYESTL